MTLADMRANGVRSLRVACAVLVSLTFAPRLLFTR
jgi:hypothetical protein